MGVTYALHIYNENGVYIRRLKTIVKVDLAMTVNRAYVLIVDYNDNIKIANEYQIELWRDIGSGFAPFTKTRYLVKNITKNISNKGKTTHTLTAMSALCVLDKRIVAAFAGNAGALKTANGDVLIQQYVTDAFINNIFNSKRIGLGLTVQASAGSIVPILTRSVDWQALPKVLVDIVDNIFAVSGIRVYYDIEYTGGFIFRTYTGQRGSDRRYSVAARPMIFMAEKNTLANVSINDNYQNQRTIAYVGGKGTTDTRMVIAVDDVALQDRGGFASSEIFIAATKLNKLTEMIDVGKQTLANNVEEHLFSADIIQNTGAIFGIDWDFGDYVSAYHNGIYYDARIESIKISWANGRETIDARLYS